MQPEMVLRLGPDHKSVARHLRYRAAEVANSNADDARKGSLVRTSSS